MKTATDWYSDFVRDNFLNMPEFIKDIQRDAWAAGAEAMKDRLGKEFTVKINLQLGTAIYLTEIPPFPEAE